MLKKVLYVVTSLLLVILITFFIMFNQINKRTNELYYDLLDEANDNNFDRFIRYQTLYYQKQETLTLPDYKIDIYLTVDKLEPIITKCLIVVIPTSPINHALRFDDLADKTRAVLINNETIQSSKDYDHYGEYPISYGLTKNKFYYYSFPIKSGNTSINLTDYNGDVILEKDLNININTSSESLENDYIKGFTSKEITGLLLEDKSYLTIVYVTFGFLIAAAVIIGYFYFKKVDLEKPDNNWC